MRATNRSEGRQSEDAGTQIRICYRAYLTFINTTILEIWDFRCKFENLIRNYNHSDNTDSSVINYFKSTSWL